MGVDCGFDIYPPLERTKANQELYELFLHRVLVAYGPQDGDGLDRGANGDGDGGGIVRVDAESDTSYIKFMVGEHPHMPRRCDHFLRFSSNKVGSSSSAETYIRGVYDIAKQWLGDRVYFWDEMNESSEHIRRHGCYNWNEIHAARKRIRDYKQQAEELEWEDTQMQDDRRLVGKGKANTTVISNKLYAIKPIQGKGQGFVATSKISKGTRVLLEAPIFKVPGLAKDISTAESMVLQEVKGLNRDLQRAFLGLQNAQGRRYTPLLGIAKTNMLPLGEAVNDAGGLFLEASRINHSCRPNAQHTWNPSLGRITVHAVRDIEIGCEITISYISGLSPCYADRQRFLKDAFCFACKCELCSLPPHMPTNSDRRLDQIRSITKEEGNATDPDWLLEHPAESLRQTRRLFELLKEEGIEDVRVLRACFDACQIAAVVGDKARVKVFAERAYAVRRVLSGDDNPLTFMFKLLAERPVEHPLYGKRMMCYDDYWEAPRGMSGEELENWLWNTDGWSR